MSIKIAIIGNKGGIGKTTTTVSLAAGLARRKYKVVAIDLDAQGSLSEHLGIDKEEIEEKLSSVLLDNSDIKNTVLDTYLENLKIITGGKDLCFFDIKCGQKENFFYTLKEHLLPLDKTYDFILLDCPTGCETAT